MLDEKLYNSLKQLGQRLKQSRIERGDTQKDFAFRIGISIPTLHKMEAGSPQVAIGTWAIALEMIGCESDLDKLIAPKRSLAERFESEQRQAGRQRVKRRK